MEKRLIAFIAIISVCLWKPAVLLINENEIKVTSQTNISFFKVPVVKQPVSSWISVQKGIYPYVHPVNHTIGIGEPISILIYLKDDSKKYDLLVKDCWAYDKKTIESSKHKIKLIEDATNATLIKSKHISIWQKIRFPKMSNIILMYTHLMAFKFPDTKDVHVTCNIQLCYGKCRKSGTME